MSPGRPRSPIIGADTGPEPPFPLRMAGRVVSGFGRGSKELGIPTANIPVDSAPWISSVSSGVYFGWAGIQLPATHPSHPCADGHTHQAAAGTRNWESVVPLPLQQHGWIQFPMVMSIGYNPFYKNTVRSAEVHILHRFAQDFYAAPLALSVLGFIRPEYDYVSKESLIADINEDIEVTRRSLDRPAWQECRKDEFLWGVGVDFDAHVKPVHGKGEGEGQGEGQGK